MTVQADQEDHAMKGLGWDALCLNAYEHDPAAIYQQSFAVINNEVDFGAMSAFERAIAVRMIHACGDVQIAKNIFISEDCAQNLNSWLRGDRRIITDARMVKFGIIERLLPPHAAASCILDQADLEDVATQIGNTKSAAGIEKMRGQMSDAIVAIGNAPTALFRLLELIASGLPAPAMIIGCPVGFVGAAESKHALMLAKMDSELLKETAVISVKGRAGGSAITAAAINALMILSQESTIA